MTMVNVARIVALRQSQRALAFLERMSTELAAIDPDRPEEVSNLAHKLTAEGEQLVARAKAELEVLKLGL